MSYPAKPRTLVLCLRSRLGEGLDYSLHGKGGYLFER
jgi:hypothetical protein